MASSVRITAIAISTALIVAMPVASKAQSGRLGVDGSYTVYSNESEIGKLRVEALTAPDSERSSEVNVTKFVSLSLLRAYLFTDERHPAHPAAVVVSVTPDQTANLAAMCNGDMDECAKWQRGLERRREELIQTVLRGSWDAN